MSSYYKHLIFICLPERVVKKTVELLVIWDALMLMCRYCNVAYAPEQRVPFIKFACKLQP